MSAMYGLQCIFFNTENHCGVMVEHRYCRADSIQVLVRNAGIKANSCNESYPSVHIIRNLFSLSACQSGFCSRLTTVQHNIKNGEFAMVHDPCDPKTRKWTNLPAHSSIPICCSCCIKLDFVKIFEL